MTEKKPPGGLDRKQFLGNLGRIGLGACMCGAVVGMREALGEDKPKPPAEAPAAPEPKPGEKTMARAAKRMEFGDGWVRRFFDVMDQNLDPAARKKLMLANGKRCFEEFSGPNTHKPGPDAFDRFSKWIAEKGQARGYSIEGRVIAFSYVGSAETGEAAPEGICLCPMGENQTPGKFSPTFCLCSVGYVKEMHERMLGRPIEVELVDSVLMKGNRCRYKMTVS